MFKILAIHKLRIAIVASPAPLKIPLIKNNKMMLTLPPSMICVKTFPSSMTWAEAPIAFKISPAKKIPAQLKISMGTKANRIDWAPA